MRRTRGPIWNVWQDLMKEGPVGFSMEDLMGMGGVQTDCDGSPADRRDGASPQSLLMDTTDSGPMDQRHELASPAADQQPLQPTADLKPHRPVVEAAPSRAAAHSPTSPSMSDDEWSFTHDEPAAIRWEDFAPKIDSLRSMVAQLSALALDSLRTLADQQYEMDKQAVAAKRLQARLQAQLREATHTVKLAESKSAEVTALEAELKLLQVEKLERDSGRHTVAHADNVLSSCRKLCEATAAAFSAHSVPPLLALLHEWRAFATREVLGHLGQSSARASLDTFPDEILVCIALKLPGQWLQRLASSASFLRRLLLSESGAQLWQACMRGRSPQPPPSAAAEEAAWRKAWFQSVAVDRNWHAPPINQRRLCPRKFAALSLRLLVSVAV